MRQGGAHVRRSTASPGDVPPKARSSSTQAYVDYSSSARAVGDWRLAWQGCPGPTWPGKLRRLERGTPASIRLVVVEWPDSVTVEAPGAAEKRETLGETRQQVGERQLGLGGRPLERDHPRPAVGDIAQQLVDP